MTTRFLHVNPPNLQFSATRLHADDLEWPCQPTGQPTFVTTDVTNPAFGNFALQFQMTHASTLDLVVPVFNAGFGASFTFHSQNAVDGPQIEAARIPRGLTRVGIANTATGSRLSNVRDSVCGSRVGDFPNVTNNIILPFGATFGSAGILQEQQLTAQATLLPRGGFSRAYATICGTSLSSGVAPSFGGVNPTLYDGSVIFASKGEMFLPEGFCCVRDRPNHWSFTNLIPFTETELDGVFQTSDCFSCERSPLVSGAYEWEAVFEVVVEGEAVFVKEMSPYSKRLIGRSSANYLKPFREVVTRGKVYRMSKQQAYRERAMAETPFIEEEVVLETLSVLEKDLVYVPLDGKRYGVDLFAGYSVSQISALVMAMLMDTDLTLTLGLVDFLTDESVSRFAPTKIAEAATMLASLDEAELLNAGERRALSPMNDEVIMFPDEEMVAVLLQIRPFVSHWHELKNEDELKNMEEAI